LASLELYVFEVDVGLALLGLRLIEMVVASGEKNGGNTVLSVDYLSPFQHGNVVALHALADGLFHQIIYHLLFWGSD